jgi:hypothetical protein
MAEIVMGHIAERLFVDDRIDPTRLQPIGRLAGSLFSRLGELFKLERPTYRDLVDSGAGPLELEG